MVKSGASAHTYMCYVRLILAAALIMLPLHDGS